MASSQSAIENAFGHFSQWALIAKAESTASPGKVYEEERSHVLRSQPCLDSCYELLLLTDHFCLGNECCQELLRINTFRTLGEAAAADWEGISVRLAQRGGTQAHEPAWFQQDKEYCAASIHARITQACCSGEVAILMLRLAVRCACLVPTSWYGPWHNAEAVQQLIDTNAWSSLLHALKALLATFGADLDKDFNAVNIVSDILHVSQASSGPSLKFVLGGVCHAGLPASSRCYTHPAVCVPAQMFYCLSEWHMHSELGPSGTAGGTGPPAALSRVLLQALFTVLEHAAYLPRLHPQQAQGDTALLMVSLPLTQSLWMSIARLHMAVSLLGHWQGCKAGAQPGNAGHQAYKDTRGPNTGAFFHSRVPRLQEAAGRVSVWLCKWSAARQPGRPS